MEWNQALGTLLAAGLGCFLAWRLVAVITARAKKAAGLGPADLTSRLDRTFNGAAQVTWEIRGGNIMPEDLISTAAKRGYRYTGETHGLAVFERAS